MPAKVPLNAAETRRNSSSSSSGGEVRAKNINELGHPTNLQKHTEWLNDLNRAFNGAKRRYRKDYRKILFALDHMHSMCRARWARYLSEQTDNNQEVLEDNWEAFQEWTLTLLKDSVNREATMAIRFDRARQLETQGPLDFSIFLDSLEKHLERPSEKTRALMFFAKLQPDLQNYINLNNTIEGKTREEVVQLAQRLWDAMPGKPKRKAETSKDQDFRKSQRQTRQDSPGSRRYQASHSLPKPQSRNPNHQEVRGKPRCYNCGSEDHLRYACDKLPKGPRNPQENSGRLK